MTSTTTSRSHGRRLVGLAVFGILIAAAGIVAGARWHSAIDRLMGWESVVRNQPAGPSTQLWTCGMHPQVIQDHPGTCPICHMALTPLKNDGATAQAVSADGAGSQGAQEESAAGSRRVKYWWDPMMNPPYISEKPGKSPMGMDLIAVYEDEKPANAPTGTVIIDPSVVQNMGVRTASVTAGPLDRPIRLVGYLDEAQPRVHDINLRVSGWIRHLHADTEGMHVKAGDPLFDVYSPELQVAIEELITSKRSGGSADALTGESAAALFDAAVKKLELLGLERRQIEALTQLRSAPETVTFTAPTDGEITEKLIVDGSAVKSGDRALRIVDLSVLWLDARVFEKDLPFVRLGQKAAASVASLPGPSLEGEIIFIAPRLDATSRTALVRIAVPNPTSVLKPGMYATVTTESRLSEHAVLVPREAVIDTGDSQVAFVAQAEGRFQPRRVQMGPEGNGGLVQIVSGLSPGETVVTSGQFLLDSESRLREAIQKFLSEKNQVNAGVAKPEGGPTHSSLSRSQQESVDRIATAYLAISATLGASERDDTPIDPAPLIAAAESLASSHGNSPVGLLASSLAGAAEEMRGHPRAHQREGFKTVSEKFIALAVAAPPSTSVGDTLYVMHCPMTNGDWVQKVKEVANPYYATDMKTCGSVTKAIATLRGSQP